jgi:uncharacterized delta-60 repeat protein
MLIATSLLAAAASGLAYPREASAETLDPSFSEDGLFTLDLFGRFDEAFDVIPARNGDLVVSVSGALDEYGTRRGVVLRVRGDGSVHPSPEWDAWLRRGLGPVFEYPDGRMLLLGSVGDAMAVARLLPDGGPDRSFGPDGVNVLPRKPFGDAGCPNPVWATTSGDGGMVVAGAIGCDTEGPGSFVARLRPDATLDRTFAGDGVWITRSLCGTTGVFVQPRGRIVVTGTTGSSDFCVGGSMSVTRLRRDGSVDRSFGRRGRRAIRFAGTRSSEAWAATRDGHGRFVLAGTAGHRFAVARVLPDGDLDRSFSGDGRVARRTSRHAQDRATGVVTDARGRVTISGSDKRGETERFMLLRFTSAGRPDTTFAPDGIFVVPFSSNFARAEAVAIDAQGRTVAVGMAALGEEQGDVAVARLR